MLSFNLQLTVTYTEMLIALSLRTLNLYTPESFGHETKVLNVNYMKKSH